MVGEKKVSNKKTKKVTQNKTNKQTTVKKAEKTRESPKKSTKQKPEKTMKLPDNDTSKTENPSLNIPVKHTKTKATPSSMKETEAKTYISLQSPTDDNKLVSAPSYSEAKDRGLVYISHVPHGFYEKQMREFFSQFGTVTNLRLGRSKKTGRSRGFAFVEFKYLEVAKIAADTMNNYLMFDKIVKCEVVPAERRSSAVFRGKIKEYKPPGKAAMLKAKKVHNAAKTDTQNHQRQVRQIKKLENIKEKLEKAGVTYSFQVSDMVKEKEAE
jgi:nucleolar protein 15